VECCIENGDVRKVRETAASLFERVKRRPVVERRQLDQRSKPGDHLIVDDHRLPKASAAMDNPVRNGEHVGQRAVNRGDVG
jgi:hypothetical protein